MVLKILHEWDFYVHEIFLFWCVLRPAYCSFKKYMLFLQLYINCYYMAEIVN